MLGIGNALYWAAVFGWSASFYQFFLKDFFATTYGFGRVIQNIEEFPYSCRRIEHEKLEGCEDLWLDDQARVLYAACAGTESRLAWCPAVNHFDAAGRRPRGSELIALDIDSPGADGLYGLRAISKDGYVGAQGDDALDLHGFDVEIVDEQTLRFYLVNHRPPVDENKQLLDANEVGANSTIEVFEMERGRATMRHVRTVFSPEIRTPNRVAAVGGGAFLVTNDASSKVGSRRKLDPFIGGGNVAYCSAIGVCHSAYDGNEEDERTLEFSTSSVFTYEGILARVLAYLPRTKLKIPNGLTMGTDGLLYVPSSIDGKVRVFSIGSDKTLQLRDTVFTGMPLDNLVLDAQGDIYAAAFPNMRQALAAFEKPREVGAPVSVLRIRKVAKEDAQGVRNVHYEVDKVIEDKESKVLSGVTAVSHDAKTGRLWAGAVSAPYLVVCDPK